MSTLIDEDVDGHTISARITADAAATMNARIVALLSAPDRSETESTPSTAQSR